MARSDVQARYGTPRATYRLQLGSGFGFDDARQAVPYLARLGASHVYLSPFFRAVPGSTHGYDVLDHAHVNEELGGRHALHALSGALREHGLGLIADFVPNHVGVAGGVNPWWEDVLRLGQRSPFAAYFDIDWDGQPQVPAGRLTFPILGRSFGEALESGELTVVLDEGDLWLRYYDHRLPLAPRSYRAVLAGFQAGSRVPVEDPAAYVQFLELLDALGEESADDVPGQLLRFRALIAAEPAIAAAVEQSVRGLHGEPGNPASFDALEAILELQHYRLRDWRVSGDEVNYRRFFDINGLAAIRVERPEVFDAVHSLLLELVADGVVTGVRVDHVDGLYDPSGYLRRLRAALDAASLAVDPEVHVPIYVEKILVGDEQLPRWPVEGTTGYDFIGNVEGLFADLRAANRMTAAFTAFTGEAGDYPAVAREAKAEVAGVSFSGELSVLAHQLYRIGQRHRQHRDHTLAGLRRVIEAVVAAFPVYRTYVADEADPALQERVIRAAVATAAAADPALSPAGLRFLADVLLLDGVAEGSDEFERRLHFRRRFQQLSGPVMAKGVEDTAFFRYTRLLALAEVGSDPGRFGLTPGAVHEWLQARAATWPSALSAGATHDTKRSDDVRARLLALTEFPAEWETFLAEAHRLNRPFQVPGDPAIPDASTEFYLYQAVLGSFDGEPDPSYTGRLAGHLRKAVREARRVSNWIAPRTDVEDAVAVFVQASLDRELSPGFARRLLQFVAALDPVAAQDALSMLWLRCFAPGVPDIYQGTERSTFLLTDPDNRGPVDFERLSRSLDVVQDPGFEPALASRDDRKHWYTRAALRLRSRFWQILNQGDYVPIAAEGPLAEHVFAFMRTAEPGAVIAAVPRLVRGLLTSEGQLNAGAFAETRLVLPFDRAPWRDALAAAGETGGQLEGLFAAHPLALLVSGQDL